MCSKNTLRVLSYNIHKGFNQLNRKYIAEEIRHSIRLINADILFLQEVIGRNDRHNIDYHEWDDDSQLEYLSDSVWEHYAYGKNAIYEHGHHGSFDRYVLISLLARFLFSSFDFSVLCPFYITSEAGTSSNNNKEE